MECHLIHDWTGWVTRTEIGENVTVQIRWCVTCGKTEVKLVSD